LTAPVLNWVRTPVSAVERLIWNFQFCGVAVVSPAEFRMVGV
jgi:hypothetical protein